MEQIGEILRISPCVRSSSVPRLASVSTVTKSQRGKKNGEFPLYCEWTLADR